jgi:hypothetical protein
MADRDYPQFAVIPAIIRKVECVALEDLRGILEIEPTLRKRDGPRLAGSQVILI